MRSSSRCFHGHNLHPIVGVLCTLSAISFFPSDNFFEFFFRSKRITWALLGHIHASTLDYIVIQMRKINREKGIE